MRVESTISELGPPPSGSAARKRAALARDERPDARNRLEIVGDHLRVLDPDPVLRLEELDQLEYAGRLDDALADERCLVAEAADLDVEVLGDERSDLLFDRHVHATCSSIRMGE